MSDELTELALEFRKKHGIEWFERIITIAYNSITQDYLSFVERISKAVAKYKSVYIVFKVHPSLVKKTFVKSIKQINEKIIVADDSDVDLYALLNTSELIITQTSTTGLEGMSLGTPVLIFPDEGDLIKYSIYKETKENKGAFLRAVTQEELEKALSVVLYPKIIILDY